MCTPDRQQKKQQKRQSVGFSTVAVREYPLTLGTVNPYAACSSPPPPPSPAAAPLALSWEYAALPVQTLSEYEASRSSRPRRSSKEMKMSAGRRRAILALVEDVSQGDVRRAEREAQKAAERRIRERMWAQGCHGDSAKMVLPRRTTQQQQPRPSIPPLSARVARGGGGKGAGWGEWDACLDGPAKRGSATIALLRRQAAMQSPSSAQMPLPPTWAKQVGGTRQNSYACSRAA